MTLPTDSKSRKETPIARGVLGYFPDAIAEIARVSFVGNEQHNAGEPMHWAREKSTDHADCIVRHLLEQGKIDTDGMRHSAKMAWRALALLQIELEAAVPVPQRRDCDSVSPDGWYCELDGGHVGVHDAPSVHSVKVAPWSGDGFVDA